MIIEIALGVVLAVIILALLPGILAVSAIFIFFAIALAAIAIILWALYAYPEFRLLIVFSAVVAALALLIARTTKYVDSRFGRTLVRAFSSGLLTFAMAAIFLAIAIVDLLENGIRREPDLLAPIYWVLYVLCAVLVPIAIYYAAAYWRTLRVTRNTDTP
jgi:hypothetical protein